MIKNQTIVIKESKNTRDKYEDGSVSGLKKDTLEIVILLYNYLVGEIIIGAAIQSLTYSYSSGRRSSRLLLFFLVIGLFHPARYLFLVHETEKNIFGSSTETSECY